MADLSTTKLDHVVEILRRRAVVEADHPAYTFLLKGERPVRTLTFQALDRRARAIASILRSHAKDQQRALMIYSSGLEFIEALWACFYARLIAVPSSLPVNNVHSFSRLQAIATDCSPQMILCAQQHVEELQANFSSTQENVPVIATDD